MLAGLDMRVCRCSLGSPLKTVDSSSRAASPSPSTCVESRSSCWASEDTASFSDNENEALFQAKPILQLGPPKSHGDPDSPAGYSSPSNLFFGKSSGFTTAGNQLERMIEPGDVLFVRGSMGLAAIGTTCGFMGHVLVVVTSPKRILRHSVEAREFENIWPEDSAVIWRVGTIECTRQEKGLHEAEMLIGVKPCTDQLVLVGELSGSGQLFANNEPVEAWQSPIRLRAGLRLDLIAETIADMRAHAANWSFATAARSVFMSADSFTQIESTAIMHEIKKCWVAEPICTSVVIVFWQRYLCKVAVAASLDPLELIFGCMPLKADRGLPGELTLAMRKCGWNEVTIVPKGNTVLSL